MYSVFFLSYFEENASANWAALKKKAPHAVHIQGIEGIPAAHKQCAELTKTPMFFVVDADNEVLDSFNFSFSADTHDQDTVHVWRCKNAVNDLVYGYGAIKLFPKVHTKTTSANVVDWTSALAAANGKYKIMSELASITRFNTSPLSTWRAAFRECTKLASGAIDHNANPETLQRLEAWCTLGTDRPFGELCIAGAKAGREYGFAHKKDFSALARINDFAWLKEEFTRLYKSC